MPEEGKKKVHGLVFLVEVVHERLPPGTNTPPTPGEARMAEQCRGDLHGIVAGHVPGGVPAFDIEVVRLPDHACRIVVS